eukprot:CAMPEP_0170189518 /NCGR_PEP_ID=MMETSP0040_2-20121228/47035_1 /TAXON_ID=641309 /ORGANISM="Lotharella oceanica, Strain CCMP622" /LENGTH=126 /DNA_ID=CAMNT_0010437121 /DNA_START=1 /DNA_END=381 /DNA_ORIENTATION=-
MLQLLGMVTGDTEEEQREECKAIMLDLDEDGDMEVTFEEFFNWVARKDMILRDKHVRHKILKDVFKAMDTDGSKTIDADELKTMLQKFNPKITNHDVVTIIKEVARGKVEIDFESFHEFVEKYIDY